MPTPNLDTAIRHEIDKFVSNLTTLVRQAALEAVKEALGATSSSVATPARRGPGRPRKAGAAGSAPKPPAPRKPGKRARRSAADVEQVAGQVLAYVQGHPGERLEEIGRGLGVDTAGLKRPIKVLLASGRLRTEGQKRGTKYFAGKGKAAPAKAKAPRKKAGKRKAANRGKKAAGRAKKK